MTYTICKNIGATLAITLGILFFPSGTQAQSSSADDDRRHGNSNPGVYPPGAKPYGLSIGEWGARWWEWIQSIPPKMSPNLDPTGANCGQGQSGEVWFLGGTFGGPAERTCTIPAGRSIFIPIFNTVFGAGVADCLSPPPGNPGPCNVDELRKGAAAQMDNPKKLEATLDGMRIVDLKEYRAKSPVFNIWMTTDNVMKAVHGVPTPAGQYTPEVSDGYWLMLKPLSGGRHTLRIKATNATGDFSLDVSYVLRVEREHRD